MKVRNPDYRKDVEAVFSSAPFICGLGIRLVRVEPGECLAEVTLVPDHLQHLGRVHGGVISSLAGHAALGAVISVVAAGEVMVAPEFNFRMFRSADKGLIQAKANVIKSGATMVFAESEVVHVAADEQRLLAKGSFTFTRAQ